MYYVQTNRETQSQNFSWTVVLSVTKDNTDEE